MDTLRIQMEPLRVELIASSTRLTDTVRNELNRRRGVGGEEVFHANDIIQSI